MAVPSSQNPSGKGTSVLPRCDPAGSAVDMITGLTEGNQPCKRDFLSSSVYPQDLWSPLMPNMLLSSRVNQASPFFPAHRTALSHPCASLPMLLCWKEPKFSSLDVGRLCLSEHVCVGYLLQLLLQLSSQNSSTEPSTYWCKGMDQGNRKNRFKPQALSFCTAEPLSLQNLALDPDQDSLWTSTYKLLLRRNFSLSYICESFHSQPFFSRQQSLLWAHFNPQQNCCVSPSYIARDFFSLCIFILLFASQSLQPPGLEGSVTAVTGICNSNYSIP